MPLDRDAGERVALAMRAATPADAAAIAALHAASWRSAYRGSFSDAYLDGPIEAERAAFWRGGLAKTTSAVTTLLLEDAEAALIGFVCAYPSGDPRWGTLIGNLHVDPARTGAGLGRCLMRAMGAHLVAIGPSNPVHLFVLARNVAAQGFYRHLGGVTVERLMGAEPDGCRHLLERIAWPSLAAFVGGVA